MIPRLIHQTWKSAELPLHIDRCVDSVVRLNPGWNHCFYTDADLEEVIDQVDEISVDEFRRIRTGLEKADVFRCAVLLLYGGVYCDVDIEAIRPFDDLLRRAQDDGILKEATEILLTTDHPIHCMRLYRGRTIFMNHFMVAKPGARFFRLYLERIADAIRFNRLGDGRSAVASTGPKRFTVLIQQQGGSEALGISLLPSDWINPLPDLGLSFLECLPYEAMIRKGTWCQELQPYVAHYWFHRRSRQNTIFGKFGAKVFERQSSI